MQTDRPLTDRDAQALQEGIVMRDDTAYRPALLRIDPADPCKGLVTVTEGRYHEVKDLISSRGKKILSMRRVAIGGLRLDEALAPGQYRELTQEEVHSCFLGTVLF